MTDKKTLHDALDSMKDDQCAELRDQRPHASIDDAVRDNLTERARIMAAAAPSVRHNRSFDRRTALKALGASALVAPFLGSRALRVGMAQAQAGERDNLLLIEWPCGMEPNWTPKGGVDYKIDDKGPGSLPQGQQPQLTTLVAEHRQDLLILSGWQGLVATDLYSHSQGPASMWTNYTGGGATKALSKLRSIDEILGERFKESRPFSVLHAGVMSMHRESPPSQIALPFYHWSAPQQGVQAEDDPGQLFMDIAGNLTAAGSGAPPRASNAKRKSILDYVMKELSSAKGRVGRDDAVRLEEHLERVRNLEQKLFGGNGGSAGASCEASAPDAALTGTAATKTPANGAKTTIAQAEVLALAFKCGLTKVATLQLGESDCMYTIDSPGATRPMHLASHNMGDKNDPITRWTSTRWMMDRVSDILTVFKNIDMGDGTTLLDKTLVVMTSEMSIQEHGDRNMPYFVAGGSSGTFKFKKAQHVALPTDYRSSKMLYTILDYFGEPLEIGDPTAAGGNNKGSLDEVKV